jgi:spore maturation protein CgeB
VGQIASPLPPKDRLQHFDLILSSLPNQVEQISSMRISSEFLPIAFDTRIIDKLPELNRDIPISFVGGISKYHGSTIPLLQAVVNEVEELQIFGYGANSLGDIPTLQARHHGECWALEMYKVLGRSVATLNRHISISENYANNMRLFEATGVGALLITDSKQNISDYFTPGEEILTYANPNEAAELARWAVNNPDEATVIAKKGQQKTLSQHTYERCMVTLDGILKKYL